MPYRGVCVDSAEGAEDDEWPGCALVLDAIPATTRSLTRPGWTKSPGFRQGEQLLDKDLAPIAHICSRPTSAGIVAIAAA